ncbi:hypothetical protein D4R47_02000, partial [archaeon]
FEHFPPFGDVLVRQALLYGLDRHGIVEAFLSRCRTAARYYGSAGILGIRPRCAHVSVRP